jgi:hypothetical protein
MPKFMLERKFYAPDGVSLVRLYAAEGKNGINLGATIRKPGVKAQTGMQTTVATEAEATKLFDERVADALARGYKPRGSGTGLIGRRSTFSELPTEPSFMKIVAGQQEPAPAPGPTPVPNPEPPDESPENPPTPVEEDMPMGESTTIAEVEELVAAGNGGNGKKGRNRR